MYQTRCFAWNYSSEGIRSGKSILTSCGPSSGRSHPDAGDLASAVWLPLHGISLSGHAFLGRHLHHPILAGICGDGPTEWVSFRQVRGEGVLHFRHGDYWNGLSFVIRLRYNFYYPEFAGIIFTMGIGLGMFSSPNIASIMNSVPPQNRGAAAGMRSTLMNTGTSIGTSILFTTVILTLSGSLPAYFATAAAAAGAPPLGVSVFQKIAPTSALFAAFLDTIPCRRIYPLFRRV